MKAKRRRLESARIAALLVAAGSVPADELEGLAERVDAFARTGRFLPRRLSARLTRAGEVPRPQEDPEMPFNVHRSGSFAWDVALENAMTHRPIAWDEIVATTAVAPPEAGTLALDTAVTPARLRFDPAESGPAAASVSLLLHDTKAGDTTDDDVLLTDAGAIDFDGLVASLTPVGEVERPAPGATATASP